MKTVKAVFVLFPMLTLLGCGAIQDVRYASDAEFAEDARLQSLQSLPPVSLAIVKTAESSTREAFFYSGGSWLKPRVGAHSAVWVRHPQGSFLFDTGLGSGVGEQLKANLPFWLKPHRVYQNHQPAKALLADALKNAPLQKIVLSHMHWDHVSGIKDFSDAEIWTTREEYDAAMSPKAPDGVFIQSQYSGADIKWRFIAFERIPYENFDHSFDMFRDGSVVLVPLPGHSRRGIGMFVNLKSGKRFFFTGDTTWTLEGFQKPAHKFWVATLLVDHDKTQIEQSILKVRRLMEAYPEMHVVPTHDDEAQRAIGFFPKFIQ